MLYDAKERPISVSNKHYLGGYTNSYTLFDFSGNILDTEVVHARTARAEPISVAETFSYMFDSYLQQHTHRIGNGDSHILSHHTYDALGRSVIKQVGATTALGLSNSLQHVDYKYNIRGWLTDINNVRSLSSSNQPQDLFAFRLNYNTTSLSHGPVSELYTGSISESHWRSASDNIRRSYAYSYDGLDRLTDAWFGIPNSVLNVTNSYNEHVGYDLNGNILSLHRNGDVEDANRVIAIDDLTYSYEGSNKLVSVTDATNHPSGFEQYATTSSLPDFEYDAYGNLIKDRHKGITSIAYNHLNQPKEIMVSKDTLLGSISYLYDAEGNKLQKQVTQDRDTHTTDYLGAFQYRNGVLDFVQHPEGYAKALTDNGELDFHYVYNYTDHLGNIRLRYTVDPETNELAILEENNYYPFGLIHSGYNSDHRIIDRREIGIGVGRVQLIPVTNVFDQEGYQYKFNAKEHQPELGLNWHDYHARNYDAALGRWMNVDPASELYSGFSPYTYTLKIKRYRKTY